MGKRLAPVLALLAMLIPAAGYALGLGNVVMHSALNQPMNAEIELVSVQSGDLDNLTVRLGSSEDFLRIGVERVFFLTKIKFTVARKADGTPYVRLSTTESVTEPFLDFVVEARWPRGRILREFTVLVDPPVLSDEAPAPIQQATAIPAPKAAVSQTPARQAPIPERAQLTPVAHRDGARVYGPVKYSDTLWVIANQMRPSGVSVNQMMLALVRDNPNAFYNNNINRLKAGYVLRINDPTTLAALSGVEANAEVERQRTEWEARKSGTLVQQTDVPAGGKVARDGATAADTSAAGQAHLKLVAPGSEGAGSGAGKGVDQLHQDLLLAAEALDANRQETEELKSRLAEMEEQLETMRRLITLKDDEMLAMQQQAGDEATAESEVAVDEAGVAMDEILPEEAIEPAEHTEMTEELAISEVETPTTEQAPKPATPPQVAPEPGLLDSPLVLYGGIGIVLLIVVALIIRRRRMQEGFEESILNVGEGGETFGATAETMAENGESSMVSDFAMSEMSGMNGIQTDAADVDPVSEADVYLAYGRHQQAEDILNEALEKDPERNELKLKLLEVHFAAKDREAFEQCAHYLHEALDDESSPLWTKAVTMGVQLCPGNELFGSASAEMLKEELEEGVSDEENDENLLDFDFDLDSGNLDAGADTRGTGGEAAADVFAELEAVTDGSETAVATGENKEENDHGLDFDVSSLDFNLDADEPDEVSSVSEVSADTASTTDNNSLDSDLEGLSDATFVKTEPDAALEVTTEVATDADSGDEFTLEALQEGVTDDGIVVTDEATIDLDDELTVGDFDEVDEVSTKLDLAKAYVDMGDKEGARSVLGEVTEEGNDDQKHQARQLLAQIG
jgi:pilus assembly protein FimV